MSDNRPAVYFERNTETEEVKIIVRASAAGSCIRILHAYLNGLTPAETPEWMQEKYDQGNAAEDKILSWFERTYNGTCWQKQSTVEVKVGSKMLIRGHIDARFKQNFKGIIAQDTEAVIEAKAFSKGYYEKFKRCMNAVDEWESFIAGFPFYATQISIYMAALNMPGIFVIGIKDDDGEVQDYEVFVLQEPPIKLSKIKARLLRLPKMEEMPACDEDIYPCPFFFIHDEKEIVRSTDTDLGELAKQWWEAQRALKKAEEEKKYAAEYIAKAIDNLGMEGDSLIAHDEDDNEWRIKDVKNEGREYFDVEAARKDDVEVGKYMKKGKGSRWPKITPPKNYASSEGD